MISFLNRPKEDEEPSHTDILRTLQAEETIRAKALRPKMHGVQRLPQRQHAWSRVSKGKGNGR